MMSVCRYVLVIALSGLIAVGLAGAVMLPTSAEAAVVKERSAKVSPPAASVPSQSKVKKNKAAAKAKAKSKRFAKKKKVAVASSSSRGKKSGGRCEPQSLTYARQRSGIMRSRTGRENGPLTWFSSEEKLGKTSQAPVPGSVLILGADRGHGMGTGHVAYVEDAYPIGPETYRVIFSHTNYDRRCSLETNIEAKFDSSAMTLNIVSGAWQPWAKKLKVAGFIEE